MSFLNSFQNYPLHCSFFKNLCHHENWRTPQALPSPFCESPNRPTTFGGVYLLAPGQICQVLRQIKNYSLFLCRKIEEHKTRSIKVFISSYWLSCAYGLPCVKLPITWPKPLPLFIDFHHDRFLRNFFYAKSHLSSFVQFFLLLVFSF